MRLSAPPTTLAFLAHFQSVTADPGEIDLARACLRRKLPFFLSSNSLCRCDCLFTDRRFLLIVARSSFTSLPPTVCHVGKKGDGRTDDERGRERGKKRAGIRDRENSRFSAGVALQRVAKFDFRRA